MLDYLISYEYKRNGNRYAAMEVIAGDFQTDAIAKFIYQKAELNQAATLRDRDLELAVLSVIELGTKVGDVVEALEMYDST